MYPDTQPNSRTTYGLENATTVTGREIATESTQRATCSPMAKRPTPSIVRTNVASTTRSPGRSRESRRSRGVAGVMRSTRVSGTIARSSALKVRPALTSDSLVKTTSARRPRGTSGICPSSFRSSVTASSAIDWAVSRCEAVPTTSRRESSETNGRWIAPVRIFASRMRRTEASMRAAGMSPRATAAVTAAIAAGTSAGMRSTSLPASTARTELSSTP